MKKTIKLLLPLLVVAMVYMAINKPKKAEAPTEKNINLNFKVKVEDSYEEIKSLEYLVSDEETLGEVFDKINGKELDITLKGDKDSEWGRYILGVADHISNEVSAPYWLINSTTNSECLSLGFCNGLDKQSLEDQDIFDIIFE